MENEIWLTYRERKGRHSKIEGSSEGNIKIDGVIIDFESKNLKKPYYVACGIYVHRIIAELFIPNPKNKPQVDHIDTNPRNNHPRNLRWVTNKENMNNKLTKLHLSEAKIDFVPWNKGLKLK